MTIKKLLNVIKNDENMKSLLDEKEETKMMQGIISGSNIEFQAIADLFGVKIKIIEIDADCRAKFEYEFESENYIDQYLICCYQGKYGIETMTEL